MSVADLVRRLQSRADTTAQARPDACGTVRTVALGANTGFQAVRTPELAPVLAIRPVFAPVALFAPITVEAWESFGEGAAAVPGEAARVPAALFNEGRREAFEERAAIMEFDGGLSRSEAEAAALALLADGEVSARVAESCAGCRHFGRRSTCLEPVAAGLLSEAQGFGIVWPPKGYAAGCHAFSGKAPADAAGRPYKLTIAQGYAAHASEWQYADIARFQARVIRLARFGFNADDSEDLAELLHLRDVQQDHRVLCLECQHYRRGRCGNHRSAGFNIPDIGRDWATNMQRCGGFKPAAGHVLI